MSTPSTERQSLFRRKPVEAFVSETRPDAEGGELERSIGLFQLAILGVGATIGTGIFIVLSEAVPVLVISRGADVHLESAEPAARGFERDR